MQALAKPFEDQWYVVALSEEIRTGKKIPVRLFGQDIVIWRRNDGHLGAIDSRCPHMGASLAVGRVVDDAVECPYHGFRYNETGKCIETPLRKPGALIPRTLCNRHYAVSEKGGWIFLFWGAPEDAKAEVLMEFDPHVIEYRKMRQRKLQEMSEKLSAANRTAH